MDFFPSEQAVEEISDLLVAGGAHCDCANCYWIHRIIMLLMSLEVLPKLDPAVRVVVDCFSGNNGPGTDSVLDAVFVGKCVDPEDTLKNHLDDHTRRVSCEWRGVVCALCPFFYGADASFDLWDVFVFTCDVQTGVEFGRDNTVKASEFAVT